MDFAFLVEMARDGEENTIDEATTLFGAVGIGEPLRIH